MINQNSILKVATNIVVGAVLIMALGVIYLFTYIKQLKTVKA